MRCHKGGYPRDILGAPPIVKRFPGIIPLKRVRGLARNSKQDNAGFRTVPPCYIFSFISTTEESSLRHLKLKHQALRRTCPKDAILVDDVPGSQNPKHRKKLRRERVQLFLGIVHVHPIRVTLQQDMRGWRENSTCMVGD